LSSADKGEGDSSDADVRTFWCKNIRFLEIYGVYARTRAGGGRGNIFNAKELARLGIVTKIANYCL